MKGKLRKNTSKEETDKNNKKNLKKDLGIPKAKDQNKWNRYNKIYNNWKLF